MRRVAVTGLGIICPIGNSTQEVVASLRDGRSGITKAETYQRMGFRSQVQGSLKIELDSVVDRRARPAADGGRDDPALRRARSAPARHAIGPAGRAFDGRAPDGNHGDELRKTKYMRSGIFLSGSNSNSRTNYFLFTPDPLSLAPRRFSSISIVFFAVTSLGSNSSAARSSFSPSSTFPVRQYINPRFL